MTRRQARPPAGRRFGGVLRFAWMRLRGVPREAARGCLEVDSETFMLDGLDTIPSALAPYVQAERHRHLGCRWWLVGGGLAVLLALVALGLVLLAR